MKKYAFASAIIIAISTCICIYHISLRQPADKDRNISPAFSENNILTAFKRVYAQDNTESRGGAQLMARAINGEARGESYIGQVAVGAVILNRVEDSKFPNTIAGVIYQPGAFTAVSDGQINLPISEGSTAYKAASDALNGWDPTGGCIYYFNPETATSKWIWGRPQATRIGKHIFAK